MKFAITKMPLEVNNCMHYPPHLSKLINALKKLPGVGNKSAERFAFQLLNWKTEHLQELSHIISSIPEKLTHCAQCHCLVTPEECPFCHPTRRHTNSICIIASARDAFAIEETREYKGLYHNLGGLLSPLEGIGPDNLKLHNLKQRISSHPIQEILMALDSTLEGDATAYYLKKELTPLRVPISRLAFGLPMGSSLDYVDGGTLARALAGRAHF
jgi:recombination protein RecR